MGPANLGDLEFIVVLTGPPSDAGWGVVDYCYVHEIGHLALDHVQEGMCLYGPSNTLEERETDGFAVAYLAITKAKPEGGAGEEKLWRVFKEHRDGEGHLDVCEADFMKELERIKGVWDELRVSLS